MSEQIDTFLWGNNILEDIESCRNEARKTSQKDTDTSRQMYPARAISSMLSDIVERELRRRTNQPADKPAEVSTDKKVEIERDDYKNKWKSVTNWFSYYQDRCRELETKLENQNVQSDIGNTKFGV